VSLTCYRTTDSQHCQANQNPPPSEPLHSPCASGLNMAAANFVTADRCSQYFLVLYATSVFERCR